MTTPSPPAIDVVGRTEGDRSKGATATAICNAVVGALKQSCGKGPTKAKAYPLDDHDVAVVVDDTLTTLERTLVRKGHENLVREARQVLADEVAEACRTPIEEATGRRIVGWQTQVDPNADRAFALIRLEPRGDDRPTPSELRAATGRNGRGTAGHR
jgi:uncharacterized protein YbcI